MAAKKYTYGLPQLVSEGKRGNRVLYKYQRRVPGHAQADLGRETWDLSLGGDLLQAVIRADGNREHHDQIMAMLRDPDARANAIDAALDVQAGRRVQESK